MTKYYNTPIYDFGGTGGISTIFYDSAGSMEVVGSNPTMITIYHWIASHCDV